jgi:hypothetical protein
VVDSHAAGRVRGYDGPECVLDGVDWGNCGWEDEEGGDQERKEEGELREGG